MQLRKNEPLKNPFGIADPNEEKKQKQIKSSPFDFQEQPQQKQYEQGDDLNGIIDMQAGSEEKAGLLDDIQHVQNQDIDDDIPLLEELDITSPILIQKRIIGVLLFTKGDVDYLEDPDLSGPILIVLALGVLLLLTGKVHFNYIYGFGLWGWLLLYMLMNFMIQQQEKQIDFYKVLSYLGYGLSPMLILSIISVFINLNSTFGYIVGLGCAIWSTTSVSKTFDSILGLSHRRMLIAYPLFLFYCAFVLITIF